MLTDERMLSAQCRVGYAKPGWLVITACNTEVSLSAQEAANLCMYIRGEERSMRLPDVDVVSAAVHETWRAEKVRAGVTTRPSALSGQEQLVPWPELHELDKESNRSMTRTVYDAIGQAPLATAGLSFGDAIERLKAGKRVLRAGWNGKGMWLALSPGTNGLPADKFWAPPNRAYAESRGGSADVLPCITMRTATGEILMGWLASQTDMLSDDWMEW